MECKFCLDPESILSEESCCTGCERLKSKNFEITIEFDEICEKFVEKHKDYFHKFYNEVDHKYIWNDFAMILFCILDGFPVKQNMFQYKIDPLFLKK
jgi:hypothetical protein